MRKRLLIAAGLAAGLAGCGSDPVSHIGQGAEAGHLWFVGPPGAAVLVDGQPHGLIDPKHPTVIDVGPGKHHVEEILGGRSVLDRNYEVGAGSSLNIGG